MTHTVANSSTSLFIRTWLSSKNSNDKNHERNFHASLKIAVVSHEPMNDTVINDSKGLASSVMSKYIYAVLPALQRKQSTHP